MNDFLKNKEELIRKKVQEGAYALGNHNTQASLEKDPDVYKIPIEFLTLNPFNSRIESQFLKLNIEEEDKRKKYYYPEGQKQLKDWILSKELLKNEKTKKDLKEKGQALNAIITIDGVLISGNRRFSIISQINEKAKNDNDKIKFLKVIIKKNIYFHQINKILELEIKNQFNDDIALNYDRINTMISVKKFKKKTGKTDEEINEQFNRKGSVTNLLNTLELINEYLVFINRKNNYELVSGLEYHFKILEMRNRQLNKSNVKIEIKWPIKPDDFLNFKKIFFRFLRFRPNRDKFFEIIKLTNEHGHILLREDIWTDFKKLVCDFYEGSMALEKNLFENQLDSEEIEKRMLSKKSLHFNDKILEKYHKKIILLKNKNQPDKIAKIIEKNVNEIVTSGKDNPNFKLNKHSWQSLKNCLEQIQIILKNKK